MPGFPYWYNGEVRALNLKLDSIIEYYNNTSDKSISFENALRVRTAEHTEFLCVLRSLWF
jgi:hypothetical protein